MQRVSSNQNIVIGTTDKDILQGSAGNDLYIVNHARDFVLESTVSVLIQLKPPSVTPWAITSKISL